MTRYKHILAMLLAIIFVITSIPVQASAGENLGTVTTEEVLLEEDFSNVTDTWSFNDTELLGKGVWSVSDGKLTSSFPVGGTKGEFLTNSYISYNASGSESWNGYHVSAEFTLHKYGYPEGDTTINYPQFAVCTYSSGTNRYEARVTLNANGYAITLYRRENDSASSTSVGTTRVAWKDGEWGADTFSRILHVDMSENTISAYFEGEEDNKAEYDLSNETVLTAGSIGFLPMRGAGKSAGMVLNVDVDNVKVVKSVTSTIDFYAESNWDCSGSAFVDKNDKTGFTAQFGADYMELELDSAKVSTAAAAFKGEGATEYKNYRFGADITAKKNSAGWARTGLRVYGQNASSDGIYKESYELYVRVKDASTLLLELKKVYLNESGSRKTAKLGTVSSYAPTAGVKIDAQTQDATFRVEMQVMDGVITGYIDGELAITYNTSAEDSTWGGAYTSGTFGFYLGREGDSSGINKAIIKNMTLVEAYENQEEPEEELVIEQNNRVFTNDDEKNLMLVEVDDFSSYAEGTVGTWVWEGTDTKGTGEWSIEDGLLINATDNASISTIAISDLTTDYGFGSVTTDVMLTSDQTGNVYAGPVAGYSIDTLDYYWLRLEDMGNGTNRLNLLRFAQNKNTVLKRVDLAEYGIVFERNKWYQVEMAMADGVIYGYIDGTCYLTHDTADDTVIYEFGQVGVRSSQGSAIFDNFAVKVPKGTIEVEDNLNEAIETPVHICGDKVIGFGGVSTDVTFAEGNTTASYAGLVAAYNSGSYYSLKLTDRTEGNDTLEIYQVTDTVETLLDSVELETPIEKGAVYNVELYQFGGSLYGYINDRMYLKCNPTEGIQYTEGNVGVIASDNTVTFDNFIAYGDVDAVQEDIIVNDTVVENPLVFTDNFEDETVGESPDYWLENNTTEIWDIVDLEGNKVYAMDTPGKTTSSWLHVFETNVDVSAKLYVASEGTDEAAQVGLITRLTGTDAEVRVAYDYAQKKWYVRDDKGLDFAEQVIWANSTSELALNTWHSVRVRVVGSNLQVWCNGSLVLETNEIKQITTGRVGVYTDKAVLHMDDVEVQLLSGQGRVEKAALENYQIDRGVAKQGGSVYWYSDDIVLFSSGNGNLLYISEDQGDTFREATDAEKETYAFFMSSGVPQFLQLHNGYIIKLDNNTGGKSYLSKDNGMTYEQVGKLWEQSDITEAWGSFTYYMGMNDMLKEINLGDIDNDGEDNYRVFYCADVRSPGVPANGNNTGDVVYHWDEVYYTDDYGYTWNKSLFDTRVVSGLESFIEARIMGDDNGVLRMLCTWNYTENTRCLVSYDYGETWQDEYAIPQLHCSRSSFNYDVDDDGTIYMCYLHVDPTEGDKQSLYYLRNRFGLIRSRDGGATWEYLMDVWRWDDVPNDYLANISQIVNPSITVTEDFIFVTAGWSEEVGVGNNSHNELSQTLVKIDKNALTAYEEWPDNYAQPTDMVKIEVTAPEKLLYQAGEPLDLTGGFLTVYYYDGSTKVVPLTDTGVEITEPDGNNYTPRFPEPNMNIVGQKLLRVTYETFADNFTILVIDEDAADGTEGDVTKYPVELKFDQAEVKEGAVINVENSVSSYTISGILKSAAGNPVLTMNGQYILGGNETKTKAIVTKPVSEYSKVDVTSKLTDAVFLDIRDTNNPFEVYGLYTYSDKTQDVFVRMDPTVAKVSTGVESHNRETSGARVRFTTDSKYIAIQADIPEIPDWGYEAYRGMENVSFDLYIDTEDGSVFYGTFKPEQKLVEGGVYESVIEFDTAEERNITIYFPILNPVSDLYIGLSKDAQIAASAAAYEDIGKIVWYGSSITQGGSVSSPGKTYAATVSRNFNMDFLNLGFWGSAKGESEIATYIAAMDDIAVFVLDYDHNERDAGVLKTKQWNFYETVRNAHPDIPIIMISRPNHGLSNWAEMRDAIIANYQKAISSGDKNVYFIDGQSFFANAVYSECLVDDVHPTDLGASLISSGIGNVLAVIFNNESGESTFDGYEYAFCKELALAEGNNVVDIKATDATGNEKTMSFTVVRAEADSDSSEPSDGNEPAPEIVESATDDSYVLGSNVEVTIKATGEFAKFESVEMDGKTVEASNYEAYEGSTVIKFKSAYMETLSEGEHIVTINYKNGSSVDAKLSILKKVDTDISTDGNDREDVEEDNDDDIEQPETVEVQTTPGTGDNSNIMLWLFIATAFVIAGFGWFYFKKKKF